MTLRVEFRREAQDDLLEAAAWYERQRSGLGEEFVAEIEIAISRAAESPNLFPLAYVDLRRAATRRFPYNVFYRVRGQRLVVLAVFHGRRDPNELRRRT